MPVDHRERLLRLEESHGRGLFARGFLLGRQRPYFAPDGWIAAGISGYRLVHDPRVPRHQFDDGQRELLVLGDVFDLRDEHRSNQDVSGQTCPRSAGASISRKRASPSHSAAATASPESTSPSCPGSSHPGDAINAAASKPFGFQAFYPGPGVGGHCIPIDPNHLNHSVRAKLGYPFRFVELAQEINASMPAYVARPAQDILNEAGKATNGASILLLGVTYKPNIADQRESPAAPLARHLVALGAKVSYHDPYVDEWVVPEIDVSRAVDMAHAVASADLTILVRVTVSSM